MKSIYLDYIVSDFLSEKKKTFFLERNFMGDLADLKVI